MQTLVQRVEVGADRIVIKGAKATLLQTLVARKETPECIRRGTTFAALF